MLASLKRKKGISTKSWGPE